MSPLLPLGAVVAVAAAARSTWSPCGLSMLSTITPFGERARRHRYAATAAWFLLGAVAGGATLGAAGAGLAAGFGALAPSPAVRFSLAAVLCGAAALVDAGAFGPVLPLIRRQVDDRWLARYRPWVYGAGFGWQIGVGFATYLMTAGVAVVLALGVLSGSPGQALLLGVVFGLARGSTVFLTARAGTPAALRSLHARLDRLEAPVRHGVAGLQAGATLGLALAAAGVPGSAPAAAALVAGTGMAGGLAGAGRASGGVLGRSGAALLGMGLAVAYLATACGSSRSPGALRPDATSVSVPATTTTSAPSAPATTVPGQLPTVYDCGGGAYEPSTLLVVCGVSSANATGVHWTSWTASGATGQGSLQLPGHAAAPATLTLGGVVPTSSGPQFSQLTATWTGTSPDGHPKDSYHLATAPAQG